MANSAITTEGLYLKGVIIPKIKPKGRRAAIITFLPGLQKAAKSDEEIWREIRPLARKIRKGLFRRTYPRLYAQLQKAR